VRQRPLAPFYNRPDMDARDERSAKNEALLREVNDRIEEVGKRLQVLPDGQLLEFRCECGRAACEDFISMAVEAYEQVRSDNDQFAVVPGHENEEIERVVERTERYVIVDKRPDAERFVGADGKPDSGN
jgi:diaminopimelate decarboxylase